MNKWLLGIVMGLHGTLAMAAGMTELNYMDQDSIEGGDGGYVTRYLVTDRYLRLDYGRDRDDYVLFDRLKKRVYNISHQQHEILLFEPGPLPLSKPKDWDFEEDLVQDNFGQKRYTLSVNGKMCARLGSFEKFLPDVAQALLEFEQVMASTHAQTYLNTPQDQRSDCDLARLVLEPKSWFKYGMPFDELRDNGFSRRLLHYKTDVIYRPKAFEIPEDYRLIPFNQATKPTP